MNAERDAASGPSAQLYSRIRDILLGYLSPVMIDSALERAMRNRGLSPALLTSATLREMTTDIMVGLRMFVAEEQLTPLMLHLAEVLEDDQE